MGRFYILIIISGLAMAYYTSKNKKIPSPKEIAIEEIKEIGVTNLYYAISTDVNKWNEYDTFLKDNKVFFKTKNSEILKIWVIKDIEAIKNPMFTLKFNKVTKEADMLAQSIPGKWN